MTHIARGFGFFSEARGGRFYCVDFGYPTQNQRKAKGGAGAEAKAEQDQK